MRSLRDLMQRCHGLRRIGSAALDLSYVACGRFEAFFEYNLKPWDVAAGTLLVREAGGLATTFTGSEDCVFGREMIAASQIHHEVLTIVHEHFYGEKA
jgi:myo-inositol-1(or 4)-monophosphatase